MTTEKVFRTVKGTIKTKAEAEDGFVLELDIPEFKSKFPIKVNRVAPERAALLVVGKTYNLVLERQSLKTGKDGKWPTDYFWGLGSKADAAKAEAESPFPDEDAPQSAQDAPGPNAEPQSELWGRYMAWAGLVEQARLMVQDVRGTGEPLTLAEYEARFPAALKLIVQSIKENMG